MDPFQMPPAFCTAQTVLIALGTFMLVGTCTSFATATFLAVDRPLSIQNSSPLRWRPIYWFTVGVFPACSSAVQIAVLVKTKAAKPADSIHCDANDPIWLVLPLFEGFWMNFDILLEGHDLSAMLGYR